MQLDRQKLEWNAIAVAVGGVASFVLEQVLASRWRKAFGRKPPDPADRSRSLAEAIAWRVVIGATAGVLTVVTRRAASIGWERVTGETPPGIGSSDASAPVS